MKKTLNIAHRGARSLAPENTLAAARKALEVGADMWELDVNVTADGELFLMHDDTLNRTTDAEVLFPGRAPWRCTDFSLAEIKQLEAGTAFVQRDPFEQIGAGVLSREDQTALYGEPVPTVREALEFTRSHSWRVNLEIKPIAAQIADFPVAEKVVAMIEALDMVEQVLVSSFVPSTLKQVRDLNPAVEIAVLTQGPLTHRRLAYYAANPNQTEVPEMQYFAGHDPLTFLAKLGSTTYHPQYNLVTPQIIERLQRPDDITLNLWTVNDRQHMRRLIEAGVGGIITDFPQVLAQEIGC